MLAPCAAGVVSLGTLYMQFMTWRDNRELKRQTSRLEDEGKKREGKLDALHSQVNGRLSELKIRIAKEAYEMGRRFQRDHGDQPSPEFPKPKVEELMAQVRDSESTEPIG